MEKSWADELEDMGQGQKSLNMTHLFSVANTCTKYYKIAPPPPQKKKKKKKRS